MITPGLTSTRLAVADLRDSWAAWLAVSLTFVTTSAAIGLAALGLNTATIAKSQGNLSKEGGQLLTIDASLNLVMCSLVALAVISASTSLVVTSRRGAVARLLLAGATPGQVVRMLLVQLAVVTVICSVVGNTIAVLVQPATLRVLADDRGYAAPPAIVAPGVLLACSLYCAAIAMLGGLRRAWTATRIPAVEALRGASGAPEPRSRRWVVALRWLVAAACFAIVGGIPLVLRAAVDELGQEADQIVTQAAFVSLPLVGLGLAMIASWIVGPLTRVWTTLVPTRSVSWHLARNTVAARAERLVRSVVPVMFAVGLLFGLMAFGETLQAILLANGYGFELEGSSAVALASMVGLPIAIAVAGSVGNLVMMSRQRDAELALSGIVGATPAQQRLLPALEATMVIGTAGVLGLVMSLASTAILADGLSLVLPASAFVLPLGTLGAVLLVSWVVTVLATLLPSLASLERPAPRVIARLVAS